jgi:hypothetical protein
MSDKTLKVKKAGTIEFKDGSVIFVGWDFVSNTDREDGFTVIEMQDAALAHINECLADPQPAPASAVNEQMLAALVKTKAWLAAEEDHALEPDFCKRCAMCDEAESLIDKAIAAAKAAKGE